MGSQKASPRGRHLTLKQSEKKNGFSVVLSALGPLYYCR
jgi:hypothetical protein